LDNLGRHAGWMNINAAGRLCLVRCGPQAGLDTRFSSRGGRAACPGFTRFRPGAPQRGGLARRPRGPGPGRRRRHSRLALRRQRALAHCSSLGAAASRSLSFSTLREVYSEQQPIGFWRLCNELGYMPEPSATECGRQLNCIRKLGMRALSLESYKLTSGRIPRAVLARAITAVIAGSHQCRMTNSRAESQLSGQVPINSVNQTP
jgi:hypothetical protein